MSRPWVKLQTGILDHFELDAVSPDAFKVYIKALALAGLVDEDGRLGPIAEVAYRLRIDEGTLQGALTELNGRILEVDGQLVVRDWLDHQSPSRTPEPAEQVAERKRRQRDRERGADVTPMSRMRDTNGHSTADAVSRTGHAALEVEVEVEKELQHPPLTPPSSIPQGESPSQPSVTLAGARAPAGSVGKNGKSRPGEARSGPPARKWAPFEQAVSESLGGISVTHSRNGKPLAWIGELCRIAGKHSDDDVSRAVELWRQFVASDEWQYRRRDLKALSASFGAWIVNPRRKGAGRSTEEPERREFTLISEEEYRAMQEQVRDLRAKGLIDVLETRFGVCPPK